MSGASVTSPGLGSGSDPKAAAAAGAGARAAPATAGSRSAEPVDGPDKPELQVAAAFAGAFLFARILKKIAS